MVNFDKHGEFDVTGGQVSFRLQFVDHFGDRQHVFGAVNLGQHQSGHTRNDRGLDIAHHHSPGPVDPHQHVRAVARHMRNGIGDQGARVIFL